jgi:hypothetical protein
LKGSIDSLLKVKRLAFLKAMAEAKGGISRYLDAKHQCELDLEEHDRVARRQAAISTGMYAGGNASMLGRCCHFRKKVADQLEKVETKLTETRERVEQEEIILAGLRKNLVSVLADSKATEGIVRRIRRDQQFSTELREEEEWMESSQATQCPGFVHPVRFSRTPRDGFF